MARLDFRVDHFAISVRNPEDLLVIIEEDFRDCMDFSYKQLKQIVNKIEETFPEQTKQEQP